MGARYVPVNLHTETALYRLWAPDGALLYVGISQDPRRRWREHGASKPWWNEVEAMTIRWCDGGWAARYAEAAAIRDERPRYNLAPGLVLSSPAV